MPLADSFQGRNCPPVRKLAEILLINPNTVARAYRDLEALGLAQARQGSGVCISEGPSPLAQEQKMKILTERTDILLTEARQMDIDREQIMALLHERFRTTVFSVQFWGLRS